MEQQENRPNRITNKELFERQKENVAYVRRKGAISEAYCEQEIRFVREDAHGYHKTITISFNYRIKSNS